VTTGTFNAFPIATITSDSLGAATALTGAEILTLKQGGVTLQSTAAAVIALATQAYLGGKLYPQTAAEAAASVTPVAYNFEPYRVLRYGADPTGAVDATAAFQNAFNAAAKETHATVYGAPGASFLFSGSTGLTIDTNRVGFDGVGCFLNATACVAGNFWKFIQSAADVNQRPMLNAAHPLRRFTLQGPGQQNTVSRAVYMNDTNAVPTLAGVMFRDVGFQDWGQDVVFDNGAFCNTFDNCTFAVTVAGSTGGPATTYSVTTLVSVNNNERNLFLNCGFYNKAFLINQLATNGGDVWLTGCSLDGAQTAVSNTGGSFVYLTNCHIESASDVANWFYCNGGNAGIFLQDCAIVLDTNKTALDLAWSDASCTNFGVQMNNCLIGSGASTFSTRLIGGPGMSVVRNLRQLNGGSHATVGQGMNALAYGGFEQSAYANDWVFTGTTPPARTNTQAHTRGAAWSGATSYVIGAYVTLSSNLYYCIAPNLNHTPPNATYWTLVGPVGSYSLELSGSSTNTPSAVATRPCAPNQWVQGEFWYMTSAIAATAGTFYCELDYLDAAGVALGTAPILSVTTNVASWTLENFKFQTPAPPGTVSAKLLFTIFGTTSGAPLAFIDDVILNII
jgi:hypothetical protein